jgi:hypothetical protein
MAHVCTSCHSAVSAYSIGCPNFFNYLKALLLHRGFISSIRGNGSNDFVIAGDRNTLKHFNGISWQQIGLPYNPQSQISLIAKQKGNTVVAVGSNGSKAFIILLNR